MYKLIRSVLVSSTIATGVLFASFANAYPYTPSRPLYCEFWYGDQLLTMPDAYMIYDPNAKTVSTRSSGVTRVYKNVRSNVGAPPYYNHGFSVTVMGDVPVLSVSEKEFDTIPILAYMLDNHEATWGAMPGFPNTLNGGLCFEHPLFPKDFQGW